MNEPISKEQIIYRMIGNLLLLNPQDVAGQQIFQILLKENSPNTATARCMIKDVLRNNGYKIDHEKIQSCIDAVQGLTAGFARWVGAQKEWSEQYPAQELIKIRDVAELVNWTERWQSYGGKIYYGGRLAAPTQDSIWLKISDFGFPFPPFALNSGMGWMELSRKEFLDLGGQLDDAEMRDTTKYDLNTLKELKRGLDSGEIKFRVKVEIMKNK
jgi:hypothetical protein